MAVRRGEHRWGWFLAGYAGIAGFLALEALTRIAVEEQLLRRDLPGYAAYSERTRKLIPFVW